MFTQEVQQLLGLGEQGTGHQNQGGPGSQGGVDVLHRYVKVKGSLVGNDVLLGDGEDGAEVVNKIQGGAVSHHYGLGYPGGAGSEVGIEGVGVHVALPDLGQQGTVHSAFHEVLIEQDAVRRKYLFQSCPVLLVGDDKGRLQHRLHLLEPGSGKLGIKGYVKTAGIHNAPEGTEVFHALFHIDSHRLSLGQGEGQGGAHPSAVLQRLGEGNRLPLVHQSWFFRVQLCAAFQVFQNIRHSVSVSYEVSGGTAPYMCHSMGDKF